MRDKAGWFLAGVLLMLLIGQAGMQQPQVGRYQLSSSTHGYFVVDSTTGEVWSRAATMATDYGTPTMPKFAERPVMNLMVPSVPETPQRRRR